MIRSTSDADPATALCDAEILAAVPLWRPASDGSLARWGGQFNSNTALTDPALAAWVNDFLALAASQAGDFGAAAGYFIRCYETALETGQLRAAIIAATNIGEDFTLLGDHHSALEWMQRALELARPAGWPRSVGACLMHTADTLRRLGQLEPAHDMLQEALVILEPLRNARSSTGAGVFFLIWKESRQPPVSGFRTMW